MDALLQRLKELDRDKFEGLIFHLLRERYPGSDIHRVDGAGGDEGVDTFLGDLAGGSTVWQAKSFSNGVRAAQCKNITSEGKLPFTLHFVLRDKVGRFTIDEALPGAPIAAVKKYSDALIALREGGQIELYDLDDERVLGRFQNNGEVVPVLDDAMLRLVTDMARVATAYGAPLVLPEFLTADDRLTLHWLVCLLDGAMPSLGNITTEILNDENIRSWVATIVAGEGTPGFKLYNPGITASFAGVPIQTGPYEVFLDQVRFAEPEQTLHAARTTPVNAPFNLTIIPVTTPRARRCSEPSSVPPRAPA